MPEYKKTSSANALQKNCAEYTTYLVEFEVVPEEDGWGWTVDQDRVFIFDEDGSAPSESGLCMEDVGEDEWEAIWKEVQPFIENQNTDWLLWGYGTHEITIRVPVSP